MERENFMFLGSYLDAIDTLPRRNRLVVYEALAHYGCSGEVPELTGTPLAVFKLMEPTVRCSKKRYRAALENGKKGGRPKTQAPEDENLKKEREKEKEMETKKKLESRSDGPDWEAIDRANALKFGDPSMILHPKPGELEALGLKGENRE